MRPNGLIHNPNAQKDRGNDERKKR